MKLVEGDQSGITTILANDNGIKVIMISKVHITLLNGIPIQ